MYDQGRFELFYTWDELLAHQVQIRIICGFIACIDTNFSAIILLNVLAAKAKTNTKIGELSASQKLTCTLSFEHGQDSRILPHRR